MKILKAAVLALAVVPAAILAVPQDASACGMSVRLDPTPQRPTPVMEIARAEKALENGQNVQAAQAILGTFPRIRVATAGTNPLETRGLRVFALAIVRSNGDVNEKKAGFAPQGEWTPKANLEWAVQSIREIDAKRPNDPSVQADLGEALAKLPHGQDEALKILAALAQKDLMGSPHAYAALANLKSIKGDTSGAEAAIKRCEEMSKGDGTKRICKSVKPAAKA